MKEDDEIDETQELDYDDRGDYEKEMREASDYAMGAYQSDEWWERGSKDDDD